MVRLQIDPKKVDREFLDWLGDRKPETIDRLADPANRWLVADLIAMKPSVRRILTKCASDCLPPWLKAEGFDHFVKGLEKLESQASEAAKQHMRDAFHWIDKGDDLAAKEALAELEAAAKRGDLEAVAEQIAADVFRSARGSLETYTSELLDLAEGLFERGPANPTTWFLIEASKREKIISPTSRLSSEQMEPPQRTGKLMVEIAPLNLWRLDR